MNKKKFLGIYLNPADVQSEGIEEVFRNLEYAGATAIAFPTQVARPAAKGKGVRFPELHMDGYERILARPLFGKREIHLEFFQTIEPDPSLYEGIPYKPSYKKTTDVDLDLPLKIAGEARNRGMEVHIQLAPFVPAGIRPEEQPRYVDGTVPVLPQITQNACLNSPVARSYAMALIQDTASVYREAYGLFLDWAEYGAYRLQDHFTCFCSHCEQKAIQQRYDWERIRKYVLALWNWIHSLNSIALDQSRVYMKKPWKMAELLAAHPGWLDFLRFKANTVTEFYQEARGLLDGMGLHRMGLSARGWPPPWNLSSGMNYRGLSEVCNALTPKLFTFDYSAMPRWYGQTLLSWNPGLSEREALDAIIDWMDLPDDLDRRSFAHYHIPAPDELHPARLESYRERVDQVIESAGGRAACYPFAHAYLPEIQWKRKVALIRDSQADGMWVQMYGYLSDAKLNILKQVWNC